MERQATRLRAQRPLPGAPLGPVCTVSLRTAVASNLPAYRRWRSCNVANKIKAELVVKGGVDRVGRRHKKQSVAICGCANHRLSRNIATGTRPVLDDERLAEPLLQPLSYQASSYVGCAASRKTYHQPHRPCRIGLRLTTRGTTGRAAAPAARCRKVRRGSFIVAPSGSHISFDHLVGRNQHRLRHGDIQRARRLGVDNQLELVSLHDGQQAWPL